MQASLISSPTSHVVAPTPRPNRARLFAKIAVGTIAISAFACGLVLAFSSSLENTNDNTSDPMLFESSDSGFRVGVGIHDVTGPAAEVNMMGYANMAQTTAGIHIRLRSRAFVFADSEDHRCVFVSLDSGMAGQLQKTEVVEKLQLALNSTMYGFENILISGTHSHSGQAGYLQYVLFQVTSLGFVKQASDAFVDGIVNSILKAHNSLAPATMTMAAGLLANASINRSPTSYLLNPADERRRYVGVGDNKDNLMTLIRVDDSEGRPKAMLNWFAVHGTSMNNTNRLLSGDNKGYASYLFEKAFNPNGTVTGEGSFVGSFAQTNLGDVSPNTRGPHCLDTGLPCDVAHSTCNGKNELCVASGPGKDMIDSTRIIGQRQFDKAMSLFAQAPINGTKLAGDIQYIHQFVHMPSTVVNVSVNSTFQFKQLCKPSMGYAFAAGTTDGPGAFSFKQGTTTSNPFWNAISHVLAKPSKEQIDCQHPKPILLDTGDASEPYEWDPSIVPIQILKVGQLVILGVPAEFTTMSGRRLREAVQATFSQNGVGNTTVVIGGLSNTYASYVATPEEYAAQRYEAASTLYGPNTLPAYVALFTNLSRAMARGEKIEPGPNPPNLKSSQLSFLPGVIVDGHPSDSPFGHVTRQPKSTYSRGETVLVTFQSANPRNDLRTQGTFLEVQRQGKGGSWETVYVDGDWETKFHWYRTSRLSDHSFADITFEIPEDAPSGTYRIKHNGDWKSLFGQITTFEGVSNSFTIGA